MRHRRRRPRIILATIVSLGLVAAPVAGHADPSQPGESILEESRLDGERGVVEDDFDVVGVTVDRPDATVEVRVEDGDGWSEWTELEILEDSGPDLGTEEAEGAALASEPLIAPGSTAVEVRSSGAGDVSVLTVRDEPGSTAMRPAARASAATILTRAQWGADESLRQCDVEPMDRVQGAVIHHTAGVNDYTQAEAPGIVRSIYAYHTTGLGWCDIGYNVLVDRFGTAYEGRIGSLDSPIIGAHAQGFNSMTLGFSSMGNHEEQEPTSAAMSTMREVVTQQLTRYGVNPSASDTFVSLGSSTIPAGRSVTMPVVVGHRDVGATACPGLHLYSQLPTLRTDVEPTSVLRRLAGEDRWATAAAVSQEWPAGVGTAYLASGEDFPDALVAAARAGVTKAPVLITRRGTLPEPVRAELERLRPQHVVVLGSDLSVSDTVAEAAGSLSTSGTFRRVAGDDRYETASALADAYPAGVGTVYLAAGHNFPDALAVAALAGREGNPLLLTRTQRLDDSTRAQLQRLRPGRVVVLGQDDAVSSAVAEEARSYTTTGELERWAGDDRYGTAARVAAEHPEAAEVWLASGEKFPDALVGAARAGQLGSPLLLTRPSSLPQPTYEALAGSTARRGTVLGDELSVTHTVERIADGLLRP